MYSLLKHLREKQYYALWFALSAAFFLVVQYPNLNIVAKLPFFHPIHSTVEIVHQADLVDSSKGSFLVRNPISDTNQSITNWSIELRYKPECCSVKAVEIYGYTDQLLSAIRNNSIIKPDSAISINPGTFIRVNYELNKGKLDDIIVSADNFGISLKYQKEKEDSQKMRAYALKLLTYLVPVLILLALLYDRNRQFGILKNYLRKKEKQL